MESVVSKDKPLTVAVIGGSLAGLMAGIVIRRLGHNVQVLEQYPSDIRQEVGAGITAGPFAQDFFSKYDLVKEPYSIPSPGFQILDKELNVKRARKQPMQMSTWNVLHYRLRANFDGFKSEFCESPILPASQGEGSVKAGAKVTNLVEKDGKVLVEYQDILDGGKEHIVKCDLVIAADGASSTIRQKLLPGIQRTYSGYLGWRGYVDEKELSENTKALLDPKVTAFDYKDGYAIGYFVPGPSGSLETGDRRYNWVWYWKCDQSSTALKEILTDTDNHIHRNSIPKGKLRPEVWNTQLEHAKENLNSIFIELVNKTKEPFLSVIQDYAAPQAALLNGKVLLIGDALATFRPHMALSLNQSALHSLLLEKLMKGEMSLKNWEKQVVLYGYRTQLMNVAFGNFYMYGGMVLIKSLLAYIWSLLPFNGFLKSSL